MQLSAGRHERALFSIISLMSLFANLHIPALSGFVDRRILLATLGASIVIALFHYLQLLLSIGVVSLSVGANLPDGWASAIGVFPPAMTAALAVIVLAPMLSYLPRLLSSGNARSGNKDAGELRQSLLAAIARGDQAALHSLLAKNVEINFRQDGVTPLLLAAEKGYSDITQILVRHGADIYSKNEAGLTAMDIALSKKFIRTAEVLCLAAKEQPAAR